MPTHANPSPTPPRAHRCCPFSAHCRSRIGTGWAATRCPAPPSAALGCPPLRSPPAPEEQAPATDIGEAPRAKAEEEACEDVLTDEQLREVVSQLRPHVLVSYPLNLSCLFLGRLPLVTVSN